MIRNDYTKAEFDRNVWHMSDTKMNYPEFRKHYSAMLYMLKYGLPAGPENYKKYAV